MHSKKEKAAMEALAAMKTINKDLGGFAAAIFGDLPKDYTDKGILSLDFHIRTFKAKLKAFQDASPIITPGSKPDIIGKPNRMNGGTSLN